MNDRHTDPTGRRIVDYPVDRTIRQVVLAAAILLAAALAIAQGQSCGRDPSDTGPADGCPETDRPAVAPVDGALAEQTGLPTTCQ